MSTAALAFARSSARPRRFAFDSVLLLTVGALLLLGLVMMTSASISIADRQVQEPLHYFERQMVGVTLGLFAAAIAMVIPTTVWERLSLPLLLLAFLLPAGAQDGGVPNCLDSKLTAADAATSGDPYNA